MRKSVLLALGAAVATVLLPFAASGALVDVANDTICTGAITGSHHNVIVPAGESCEIDAASIKGNVKVFGSLTLDDSAVRGNVDGEPGHGYVRIGFFGSAAIKGNVQIKGSIAEGMKSGYGSGLDVIRGNFQFEQNASTLVAVGATIGGNLKAQGNSGGGAIMKNVIGGNLECSDNDPEITESGNTVNGNDVCPPSARLTSRAR